MDRSWPLTGRETEFAALSDVVGSSGRSGLVLGGPAGVGKTRLVREVIRVRRPDSVRWFAGTTSARVVPLGAFAGLVPGDAGVDAGAIRLSAEALQRAAPALVVVDDAHLLDDASASLVHHIALSRLAPLVVTVRSDTHTPDAITALWKDSTLPRLELGPLPLPESVHLLERVLEGAVESDSARRLWTAAAGNALYLRLVVEAAVESGTLRPVADVWRWTGGVTVSPLLAELLDTRIGRLPPAPMRVAELLAFSEPLSTALLDDLVGPGAAEDAERRGLVTVEADGRRIETRLVHPLYGEVVRARTGVLAARRIRGELTRRLAAAGTRRSGDVLRLSVLSVDSDVVPDPALLTEGARRATALADHALGERLARAAIEAGAGFEAALNLGYVVSWRGDGPAAHEIFTAIAEEPLTDEQLARVTTHSAANLFWNLDRPDSALDLVSDNRARMTDSRHRYELTAVEACYLLFRGRPADAEQLSREVLDSQSPTEFSISWSGWIRTAALAVMGRPEDERPRPRGADRAFHASVMEFDRAWADTLAARLAGDLDTAEGIARAAYRSAAPGRWGLPRASLLRGQVALEQGRIRTAVRWLREGLAGFGEGDSPDWRFECLIGLTKALGMAGQAAAARRTWAQTEAAFRPTLELFRAELRLARAWSSAADGALGEAVDLCRQAAAAAAETGQSAVEGIALHTAVCFGDDTAGERLGELADVITGPRIDVAAEHAIAVTRADADALLKTAERFEELGALLLAADSAAQAVAVFARRGDRRNGSLASARVATLAARCEGAASPALSAWANPLVLTGREREIASLVAHGLSNRQIAERLVVSTRTVEGHIYRACQRLGLTDRTDLGRAVRLDS